MVDSTATGERIETKEDLGTGDAATFSYWQAQEKIAEKEERQWVKKAREIVKRYRDERPQSGVIADSHRFNILWSNVQTLLPTLYARTPKPDVQRRFLDQDPTGRLAAILLERCLSWSVESGFDDALKAVVQDRLLPGRGVARVLYVPHFGEEIKDDGEQTEAKPDNEEFENADDAASVVAGVGDEPATEKTEAEKEPLRKVDFEEAQVRYVFWEDYREGPARQWIEVPWVRYRSYLSRDKLVERFGDDKGKKVELDYTPKGYSEGTKDEPPPDIYKKAVIHETWDKTKKETIWWAPSTPDLILDCQDDPLKLPEFFPNPDPLAATLTNDKRIPVPDYIEYQDQARELDKLTARIDKLTEALRVAGFYPGENKSELSNVFDAGTENKLIPVLDWAAFANKIGPDGFIVYLPIKQIAETLIQLYNARDRVKALLYEITGLSDILRGATVPTETLGAQQLKANFATRRVSPQQREVARFARDLLRLMGGVIAAHFSPQTISLMTGYPQLDPVPQLPPQPMPPAAPPMLPAPVGGAQPASNGGGAAPMPGMNGGGPPQQAPPDPAMQAYQQQMAQWQQMKAAADAVSAANQQKQAAFDKACELIRQDGPFGFRIDIETDSTIAPDEQAEKQSRIEFLGQMVPLMERVLPAAQGNPALASLVKDMVLFAARGFKVARQLEESFEKSFDAIGKMPPPAKEGEAAPQGPQGPHPAQIAADVAGKAKEADTKLRIAQMQTAQKAQQADADRNLKAQVEEGKQIIDHQRLMLEAETEGRRAAHVEAAEMHKQASDASNLT